MLNALSTQGTVTSRLDDPEELVKRGSWSERVRVPEQCSGRKGDAGLQSPSHLGGARCPRVQRCKDNRRERVSDGPKRKRSWNQNYFKNCSEKSCLGGG